MSRARRGDADSTHVRQGSRNAAIGIFSGPRLRPAVFKADSTFATSGIELSSCVVPTPMAYPKVRHNPSPQPRLSGPSGPEKCRGQGAATQTVRMYGKEAATPPSAFSQARASGPLFKFQTFKHSWVLTEI